MSYIVGSRADEKPVSVLLVTLVVRCTELNKKPPEFFSAGNGILLLLCMGFSVEK